MGSGRNQTAGKCEDTGFQECVAAPFGGFPSYRGRECVLQLSQDHRRLPDAYAFAKLRVQGALGARLCACGCRKCRDAEYSIKYVVNPEIIERQIADEWLLVPVGKFAEANNCMISLNSTSHFLWNLFKTPCTLNEALKKAKETYEDATGTMEVEVREFVTEYSHLQLLLKA